MKTFKEHLKESRWPYVIYHNSYTSAIEEVRKYATNQGYSLDDDEMFDKIGMGPRKPGRGKTNRFTITLYKGDRPQRKALHFQVYNRETNQNPYELNMYIS